jgi:PTH1 family peptidyl-tRNA hydrolase
MSYIIVGLGNPGEEYTNTRHNTGRLVLYAIKSEFEGEDFKLDKKSNALVSKIEIKGLDKKGKKKEVKATLVAPETFMNNSGQAVSKFIKNIKGAEKLVVIYDDFNLPLGKIRVSYNRSSGGHNGLESVIKAIKTEAFARIRVGVAPETASGIAKVPHGEEKIEKFILGKYKEEELKTLKKVYKTAIQAVSIILCDSKEKAMSVVNGL